MARKSRKPHPSQRVWFARLRMLLVGMLVYVYVL